MIFIKGIYKITIPGDNRVYVGSSDDIEKRYGMHWAALNAGNHHSYKLQKAFNKLRDKFSITFEIIEECSDDVDLLQREDYWIRKHDSVNTGYNIVNCLDDVKENLVVPMQKSVRCQSDQIRFFNVDRYNRPYRELYALSMGWFSNYGNITQQQTLRKSLNNLCYYHYSSDNFVWTTFDQYHQLLSGVGRSNKFIGITGGSIHDKTDLAFAANLFLPACNTTQMFDRCPTTNDTYALHALLNWLWLSPLRDGEQINLYLPSRRMRELLKKWIDEVSE